MELSPAQQRLWDIYCLDKGNSAYHMSGTFHVNGELDIERLTAFVNQVLERHDVLRTRFITNATGQVIQFVDKAAAMYRSVSMFKAGAKSKYKRHSKNLSPRSLNLKLVAHSNAVLTAW